MKFPRQMFVNLDEKQLEDSESDKGKGARTTASIKKQHKVMSTKHRSIDYPYVDLDQ